MPESDSTAYVLAGELLAAVGRCSNLQQYRESSLTSLQQAIDSERIAWVYQEGSHWAVVGPPGALVHLPIDLAASAAAEMQVVRGDGWLAAPITGHSLPAEVILVSPHQSLTLEMAEAELKLDSVNIDSHSNR